MARLVAGLRGQRNPVIVPREMGTVMGVVLGLSPLLYLLARSNDRKAAAKKGV